MFQGGSICCFYPVSICWVTSSTLSLNIPPGSLCPATPIFPVLRTLGVMLDGRDICCLKFSPLPTKKAVSVPCSSAFLWERSRQFTPEVICTFNRCIFLDPFITLLSNLESDCFYDLPVYKPLSPQRLFLPAHVLSQPRHCFVPAHASSQLRCCSFHACALSQLRLCFLPAHAPSQLRRCSPSARLRAVSPGIACCLCMR